MERRLAARVGYSSFNKGRSGIVNTPELGQAMAERLGRNEGVLLWGRDCDDGQLDQGHRDARNRAARQRAAATDGDFNGQFVEAAGCKRTTPVAAIRTWEYLKREVTEDTGGRVPPSAPPATRRKPSDPIEAAKKKRDLVLANRILASEELSILDVRSCQRAKPERANPYFIASGVPAAAVKFADIVQRNTSAPAADSQGLSIHDEGVQSATRGQGRAVCAHAGDCGVSTHGSITLRPIVNGGAFADALPVLNMPSTSI